MTESKITTRKLLVGHDPTKPHAKVKSDFLVPILESEQVRFYGLRTRRLYDVGCLSYLGSDVSANDVFGRLVDSGRKIPDVQTAFQQIENYLKQLQEYHIGNVLGVEGSDGGGFKLKLIANSPPSESAPLP